MGLLLRAPRCCCAQAGVHGASATTREDAQNPPGESFAHLRRDSGNSHRCAKLCGQFCDPTAKPDENRIATHAARPRVHAWGRPALAAGTIAAMVAGQTGAGTIRPPVVSLSEPVVAFRDRSRYAKLKVHPGAKTA